jgi:hypothetical protein
MTSRAPIIAAYQVLCGADWRLNEGAGAPPAADSAGLATVLTVMRSLLDANPWVCEEPGAQWLLDPGSYGNLMEAWLQCSCVAEAVRLRHKGVFAPPVSSVMVRVTDSCTLDARFVHQAPHSFIVMPYGCYELSHRRALLQWMAAMTGVGSPGNPCTRTNHLGGQDVERGLANESAQAAALIDQYVGLMFKSLNADFGIESHEPNAAITRQADDAAFHAACMESLQSGLPTVDRPLANLVQHVPVLFMHFLLFHEMGHLREGHLQLAGKRSMATEYAADLLAVDSLLHLAPPGPTGTDPFPACLASATFLTLTGTYSYCQQASAAAQGHAPDVSRHYLDHQQAIDSHGQDKDVWEHHMIGVRGQGLGAAMAMFYDAASAPQVADLLWECAGEWMVCDAAVAHRWLGWLDSSGEPPDEPLPPASKIVEFVEYQRAATRRVLAAAGA